MKKMTIRISRDAPAALKGMGERFVKAWKTGKAAGDTLQQITAAGPITAVDPGQKQVAMLVRARQLAPNPADQASVKAFNQVVQPLVVQPLRTTQAIEDRAAAASTPQALAQSSIAPCWRSVRTAAHRLFLRETPSSDG